MKFKKILCFFIMVIISISAFTGNVLSYFDGTTSYFVATKTTIGSFTYILKQNVNYGSVKIPYSATVTNVPNIKKVKIPEKVTCDGIDFLVTDLDLCGSYIVTKKNKPVMVYTNNDVQEITLPDTIYNIKAFEHFPNLLKINIPKKTAIGRNSKYNETVYYDLDSTKPRVTDYDSKTRGPQLFDFSYYGEFSCLFVGCPKLKLIVDADNPYYSYVNDLLLSKDRKELFMSFSNDTSIIFPNTVDKIFEFGGKGFSNAKNIRLSSKLIYIGIDVFATSQIKKINLPDSLREIDGRAFCNSKISKISFPNSLRKIRWNAFAGTSLKTIKLGKNLTLIGTSAFSNCKKLKFVSISKNTKAIRNKAFCNCKSLSKVTFKDAKKVSYIGKNAFKNTKKGIKFVVKNKKVAKSLKKKLKGTGVKNAKILIGKKVVYQNING